MILFYIVNYILVLSYCYCGQLDNDINIYSIFSKTGSYDEVKNALKELRNRAQSKPPVSATKMNDASSTENVIQTDNDVYDNSELSVNSKFLDDVFEGDIILTVPQSKIMLGEIRDGRKRRKVINDKTALWTSNVVNYAFHSSITNTKKVFIRAAIQHWEDNTCLVFRENMFGDYMYFVNGEGCYSNVGRSGGKQEVSIGDGCEMLGVIAHEIGHVLGFWHEHSRPDRDKYIRINMDNVLRNAEGNFERLPHVFVDDYGVPYDLGSALHYNSRAYAINFLRRTIDTQDPNFVTTIGQRYSLSFIDIKQMNLVYCANKCSKEVTATTSWQTVSYSGNNKHCIWLIKAPLNTKIRLEMQSMTMLCREPCKHYVEIKYKDHLEQTGSRLCCSIPSSTIVSMTNELVIIYRVTYDSKVASGFVARYKIDGDFSTQPITSTSQKSVNNIIIVTPPPAPLIKQIPSQPIQTMSDWDNWSPCSEKCGGCGSRLRTRRCLNPTNKCSGNLREKSTCNEQPCGNTDSVCNYPLRNVCANQNPSTNGNNRVHNDQASWPFQSPPDYSGGEIIVGPEVVDTFPFNQQFDMPTRGHRTLTCTKNLQYRCSQNSRWKIRDSFIKPCCEGFQQRGNSCVRRISSTTTQFD